LGSNPLPRNLALPFYIEILTGFFQAAGFADTACRHLQLEFTANFLTALDTDKRVGDGLKPLLGNFSSTDSTVHSYTRLIARFDDQKCRDCRIFASKNVLNARLRSI
jgi:hypothetical protein